MYRCSQTGPPLMEQRSSCCPVQKEVRNKVNQKHLGKENKHMVFEAEVVG